MAKRQKMDEAGDNEELQALFDSIADQATKPKLEVVGEALEEAAPTAAAAEPAPAAVSEPADMGDSPELQALFDQVAEQNTDDAGMTAAGKSLPQMPTLSADATPEERQEHVFTKIGQMTRLLHDTLRELGYDRMLEETAQKLPDARQRLSYIAQMTEQAASRVLNATDIAKPLQDKMVSNANLLQNRWSKLYDKQLSVEEFKQLAGETRSFISEVSREGQQVNEQLLEIMMAQDFQDLTGQVIKKIVDMAQTLESGLLSVLIEVMPESKRAPGNEGLLNGPVVNAEGREDVVTGQEQVDDLLESLGF